MFLQSVKKSHFQDPNDMQTELPRNRIHAPPLLIKVLL